MYVFNVNGVFIAKKEEEKNNRVEIAIYIVRCEKKSFFFIATCVYIENIIQKKKKFTKDGL